MKIQFKTSGILSIVVFFGVLLIQSYMIYATNQQCPIDVQILYSDDSWCSGTTEIGNDTLTWDSITITFVTLGIANLDTTIHSLNQLILTINEVNEGGSLSFLKSENLTSNLDLPLIISPQRYWMYNLSCFTCQSLAKISLKVDGEWFEFAPHQLLIDAGIYMGNNYWPPHWSEVLYYTENKITPVSILGISSSVGLATLILVFQRRRKRA
jgi:hypothetical protein